MKKYDILIIGGGAAGLAAAVSAKKQNSEITVGIVEKNDRVAKKIHATGNGRCNYTNSDMKSEFFFGEKDFVEKVLASFTAADAVRFFEELGVLHREEEGRVYPLSNQASSVADALRLKLSEDGVDFITETFVSEIEKAKDGLFYVGEYSAKKVILATGGKSQEALGSDGSGYRLLKKFGHGCSRVKPALVSLKTETDKIKGLKGVKVFARATLFDGKREIAADRGEVLFTDYGVSGIPVMQISRFAEKGMTLKIDMMPDFSKEDVTGMIYGNVYAFPKREGRELFSGMVNKKLAIPMMKSAKITDMTVKAENFTDENILNFADFLKELKLKVLGDNGFNNSQVTAGGIELSGFDAKTMESKFVKGLYAAGEILDCDAMCGGYNLHWAWATGVLAGKNAAEGCVRTV